MRQQFSGFAKVVLDWLRHRTRQPQRVMSLVETVSLSGKQSVSLMRCGGQMYLVGGGAEGVTLIVPVAVEVEL